MADSTQQQQGDEERRTQELTDKVGGFLKDGALRTGTGVKSVWHDPLFFVRILDGIIDWARRVLPRELFNVEARSFAKLGYVSLLAAAPVGLVFGITAGIKLDSFAVALYGIGFALLMIIVQYAASKLLSAGETLTMSSSTVMESDAFLRCVALISAITGVVILVSSTITAIRISDWATFMEGVGVFLLCEALSFIALHPALASTSIVGQTSTGEEAIGIVSFFAKVLMRIVPIIFGAVAFWTLLELAYVTFQQFRDKAGLGDGMTLASDLIKVSLLPLVAYVGFALFCLNIELMRAILSIKGISKKCGE
ncbi:MAG: hypothetical protein WCN95_11230 [bacterium]